jgi:hypothetical protein
MWSEQNGTSLSKKVSFQSPVPVTLMEMFRGGSMAQHHFEFDLDSREVECLFSVLNNYSADQSSEVLKHMCEAAVHPEDKAIHESYIKWHEGHKKWFDGIVKKMKPKEPPC